MGYKMDRIHPRSAFESPGDLLNTVTFGINQINLKSRINVSGDIFVIIDIGRNKHGFPELMRLHVGGMNINIPNQRLCTARGRGHFNRACLSRACHSRILGG